MRSPQTALVTGMGMAAMVIAVAAVAGVDTALAVVLLQQPQRGLRTALLRRALHLLLVAAVAARVAVVVVDAAVAVVLPLRVELLLPLPSLPLRHRLAKSEGESSSLVSRQIGSGSFAASWTSRSKEVGCSDGFLIDVWYYGCITNLKLLVCHTAG